MKCPILNPIRFHSSAPDYSNTFAAIDNIIHRTKIIDGIDPALYYKEWLYGKTLILQFTDDTSLADLDMTVYKYDITTEAYIAQTPLITADNITPVGWLGSDMLKYSITLAAGTYYLKLSNNYTSDVFVVTNELLLKRRLVQIIYTHSENDFGCIFDGQSFYQYLTGQLIVGNPEDEISAFTSDRGTMVKLRSTPIRIATLYLNDIHYTYIDHINMIFACDNIQVNGITFSNSEPPTIETIEGSDLVNITVKLFQANNDYYYNIL